MFTSKFKKKQSLRRIIIIIVSFSFIVCKKEKISVQENKIEEIISSKRDNKHLKKLIDINCDSIYNILNNVLANDQKVREYSSKIYDMDSIDNINQKIVISIIEKCGFPVDKNSSQRQKLMSSAIFYVLQHSSKEIMAYYYPFVKNAVDNGKIDQRSFALFKDRLLVYYGEKQIFGTQIIDRGEGMHLAPIIDVKNINNRRTTVGLGPIENYLKSFGLSYKNEINYLKSRKK